jgi:monothiol glutaredoxin
VVLFMKGTPETPQCGFSRAAIQILGLQGVNPQKFTAFNVLEDEELRAGMLGDTLMKILDAMR